MNVDKGLIRHWAMLFESDQMKNNPVNQEDDGVQQVDETIYRPAHDGTHGKLTQRKGEYGDDGKSYGSSEWLKRDQAVFQRRDLQKLFNGKFEWKKIPSENYAKHFFSVISNGNARQLEKASVQDIKDLQKYEQFNVEAISLDTQFGEKENRKSGEYMAKVFKGKNYDADMLMRMFLPNAEADRNGGANNITIMVRDVDHLSRAKKDLKFNVDQLKKANKGDIDDELWDAYVDGIDRYVSKHPNSALEPDQEGFGDFLDDYSQEFYDSHSEWDQETRGQIEDAQKLIQKIMSGGRMTALQFLIIEPIENSGPAIDNFMYNLDFHSSLGVGVDESGKEVQGDGNEEDA